MSEEKKRSHVEDVKEASVYLKGQLGEEVADRSTTYISEDSESIGKHHGFYQEYNRDTATERKKAGLEKEWYFMVRMICPGGRLTAKQYLALEELADRYANGTLRVTTRETFQFHCIVKENLKAHIAGINEALLTTLGGCGDVVRNVMCPAAPKTDAITKRLVEDAKAIAKLCAPQTSAYHEIWLDGENVARVPENDNVEPIYGRVYLPRKFKIAVTIPEDNSMDVLTHDLGIVMVREGDKVLGYNLYLGGGLGMTHNKPETYPRIASPIAFVSEDKLLQAVEAVVKLQRDHGDRVNRKHSRLKYVVEEQGIAWTKATLNEYIGYMLEEPRPTPAFQVPDHMGWHQQGDGRWFLGVPITSGRIVDTPQTLTMTGLHKVIKTYGMDLVLTADQNVILCDIKTEDKTAIEAILREHGFKLREDITDVDRFMLACVAMPTCGLALAEAERVQADIVRVMEQLMKEHAVLSERIAVRVTGCPNGCARPYVGDIGIVGRAPGLYAIFIGGDFEGTRLNTKILDKVPFESLSEVFGPLFKLYAAEKNGNEGFGDFVTRKGINEVVNQVLAPLALTHVWAKALGA